MTSDNSGNKKISIEFVLYCVILIVSLAFRFASLGRVPLNDTQARLALDALNVAQGKETLISGEPGYISLTAVAFFIFGATDFFARFWPALIGSLIVLLPLLFRDRLGKVPALILSFLMALDPFLINVSRSAVGSIFGLVGLLAGIGFWIKRKPIWSGIAFGTALLGGVDLWPGAITLGLALLISTRITRSAETIVMEDRKNFIRDTLISLAVTVGIISTILLTNPKGISTIGSSLAGYFNSWGQPAEIPFYSSFFIWVIVELPALILGIWGLIIGIRKRNALTSFCGIWWGVGLLLAVMNPSRSLAEFYWISVPVLILAVNALVQIFSQQHDSKVVLLAETAVVIALFGFSFLNFIYLVNSYGLDAETMRNRIIGTLVPLVLLIVVTGLFAWGWSAQSTRKGFSYGLVILLFIGWFGSAWKAADLGSRPEFEFRFGGRYPVGEYYLLDTVSSLSRWSNGQARRIDVQIAGINSASLDWSLRDFENTGKELKFNPKSDSSIVITTMNEDIQSIDTYRGQRILWSTQPDFANMTVRDWLIWSFFRTCPQQKIELILWAKNALFL